jgi:serine/threonine-protein kinase RsbW
MFYQDNLTVHSNLTVLNHVQKWFEKFWLQHNSIESSIEASPDYQLYRLNLALAEGFTNAVRHAHSGLSSDTSIDIQVALDADRMEIRIWDWGQPFDPNNIREPQPGTLQEGGYGWFLLRRLADEVSYDRQGQRNCLRIVKYTTKSDLTSVTNPMRER